MNFNIKNYYWFLLLLILPNGCEDNINNAESSETLFSVTFDIGKNDRVLDIEQTNDNGYIILLNNESNSINHTGSYFLLKIDQYGIEEQLERLDTTIYSGYNEVGQINDESYIVKGFYQTGEFPDPDHWVGNVLRINSDLTNQTQNYEPLSVGKFNSEGYIKLVRESSFIWETFTWIHNDKLSSVLWTGDTLWVSEYILSEIVAVDSNFSAYNQSYYNLSVAVITVEGGCILMGQNDGSLHLAKINPEGNVEWVKIIENGSYDEVNVDGNAFLFDHIEQTIDGGYIISGANLMKLSSQGEFEWINENPIEVDDITNTHFDVKQINDGSYLLVGYDPNNDPENGVPYIIKTDNLGNVLSRVDFTDFLPPICLEATDDGGYIFSASYDIGNGDTDVAIIKFDSDGHMLELGN